MNIEEIKPAIYTQNASSDIASIATLESIFDTKKIIAHLSKNDKTPNYDGYLELIEDGSPIGEMKVQVKTLKKDYKNPSYSSKLPLLKYARNCQIPFLLVAVDQKEKKAFWCEINREKATNLINDALSRSKKSIAIKFEKNNEIPTYSPYIIWKTIVEDHLKLIHNSSDLIKQNIITKAELEEVKLKLDIREREVSPNYIQLHLFLDTLNNLFSNEFKIIRKLFVSDFWKFGIITFGQIAENRIAYCLFSIGWNENLKQISEYQESDDFQKFISDYPSVRAYSGTNPILSTPVNYAYEILWGYLKLMLERNLIWPNNQYLQNEYLFYTKDRQFRNSEEEEAKTIDLISLKEGIENYFRLIPNEERRMKQFPEMENNLYRALEYIQNFRIEGKTTINRLSPSKRLLQNIATTVGEKGKLPENIEATLLDYWSTLLNSYENVLDEFFPLVKEELSNNNCTYIIIPFIEAASFNDGTFNIAQLAVLKFKNENKKTNRTIFIEMNQANVKLDFKNRIVLYKEKRYKFSTYENERMSISSLIDDMPIRKGVYNLLTKNLKSYFEKFKEK